MIIATIIGILLLGCLSAICYRAGGISQDDPCWIPVWLRKRWVRDWICPVFFGVLCIPHSWFELGMWLLYYGACGGFLTTYWDFLFGYDNLWFAGFWVGMAGMFLFWAFPWWVILLRALALAIIWGGLNYWINKHQVPHSDDVEEYTRGFTLC